MNPVNAEEHGILSEYKNTMGRVIQSLHPYMDRRDIDNALDYSISKRFKNFDLKVLNNYTGKTMNLTALEMLDYIYSREPIMTSYGTLFKKHESVPNPLAKVIQNFIDLRKIHKKEMFKYPKGSEQFEYYNLLQNLDKIDVNGIYGLSGLYVSLIYDLNIAPAITSTGRALISSAILCFEGFLANNVHFSSLNDILIFIDNIRMEFNQRKFNDYEILGTAGFVDAEECFYKVMMNCGYKYIPTEQDMDIVYGILRNCNQTELNRIFYKNNLYSFMDLFKPRDLMVKIVTGMQVPYIEPANPPQEIVPYLDELRDILLEYVFYCHQWMDRMDRNKTMIKKTSIISDTDSSFLSLDAWYNYNMQYLQYYDCPILHQTIDMYKYIENDKKSDWWKDREIPEWYNAIDKVPGLSFNQPSRIEGLEFLDNELDFDFYNRDIIEKKRLIEPFKIIPQDNMRFALINIMCYVLSSVINLYMIDFTKQSKSYRGDDACKISMKNEFYMSRVMLTTAKKCYVSLQKLQEGNYLGDGSLAVAGIDVLTKSVVTKDTQKALKKIILEDILTAENIDQLKLLKDIAILEKQIYTDLRSKSKKYYKPMIVKSMDVYEFPLRNQGIKASIAWNYVKNELPGFDLSDRNPMDIIKVKVNKDTVEELAEKYPYQYERFKNILDKNCQDYIEGSLKVSEVFSGSINAIALPKDIPVPEWVMAIIDYEQIIEDNISGLPTGGILGTFDKKKVNYSNVIHL